MCGAQNSDGLPRNKFVNPPNLAHALNLLKQHQRYVDWTIGADVIGRARLCFKDGEPFSTALGSSLSYLTEMKIIRNRIAHQSREVDKPFTDLVRQKIGSVPRGMGAGKFLMSRILATSVSSQLEDYRTVLLITANSLVS